MITSIGSASIDSLCLNVTSGGTPYRRNEEFWANGTIPWIKTGELKDCYIYDAEEKITEAGLLGSSAKVFPINTVLMAMYGDGKTITSLGIVKNEVATNQACCAMITNPDKCDYRYLYYALMHHRHRLLGLVIAGAQRNLSIGIIKRFKINTFPLKTQQKIASILSIYDDQIENNRRRIQLLEQAARILYKEWFVHLRFPGHEHIIIKDGVPEGWEKKPFPDVVDFKEGPGLRNYQYRDEGIPFLNIRTFNNDEIDLSKTKCINEMEVASKYQHFLLEEDDHVVSSSGTLGRIVTVRQCHLPIMLNTSLIRMRPKGAMKKWFLKAYLKYGDFIDQARSMATGAAQLNYGPSHLKAMSLLMPNNQLIELFEDYEGAIYNQIKVLLDSNLQLTQVRDLLLPRLMNGEVAV